MDRRSEDRMPIKRFHPYYGENIKLLDEERVAYRESSFSHAISFSERALRPMEIFLIEIEKNERGWSGHLRIGLTQHDPNRKSKLPQYALPDLANQGKSWIFAVTKSHNKVCDETTDGEEPHPFKSILGNGEYVNTYRGPISKSILRPLPQIKKTQKPKEGDEADTACSVDSDNDTTDNILPTDVGSRIGIVYVIRNKMAEMHFIINGEDQGPFAKDIPYKEAPLYAVVDVYGTTKQVRIIQADGVGTLENSCREVILQVVNEENVSHLPIPTKLKEYLCYEVT